ncbi:hypothetical protein BBD42_28075 [Paenibacillus sp. BIHB 4019]|uniref:Uncharacterized protein n=1 Tax=Paenibacillus sp. BIHB 4019 TaxID=1870819 RepID=A0A1B2DQF1_9BACL|nr:hypothetical protein [Paenibacillus sp. BIHB 4019]ANY69928.1 hypothetical protein BBD42_28075 [Paenibacillus sp. BIHB 4019]
MSLPTLVVLCVAFSFGMIQMPALFKKKLKREAWAYFALLSAGTAFSIYAANVQPVPSPLNALITIYEPINQFFDRLLSP